MIIKCKVADGENCPKGLNICCGTCEDMSTCRDVCTSPNAVGVCDPKDCDDAEIITDELTAFNTAVPETIGKITSLIKLKKQLEDQEKQLKQKLVEAMETYGVKIFENDLIKMTYVAPTTRSTIDSARLKKDHPAIAEQYSKVSDVAASVRVTLKGGDK